MPKQRAPLLSLSASGKVGGHRRGRSRRITPPSDLTFTPVKAVEVQHESPDVHFTGALFLHCYVFDWGQPKYNLQRSILAFDLSSLIGSTILTASLTLHAYSIVGVTAAKLSRSSHAVLWSNTLATWNDYAAPNPWASPGGGEDDTTPPFVPFTTPSAIGLFTIDALAAHAQDALDNRSAMLSLIVRIVNETSVPGIGFRFTGNLSPSDPVPSLVITLSP